MVGWLDGRSCMDVMWVHGGFWRRKLGEGGRGMMSLLVRVMGLVVLSLR